MNQMFATFLLVEMKSTAGEQVDDVCSGQAVLAGLHRGKASANYKREWQQHLVGQIQVKATRIKSALRPHERTSAFERQTVVGKRPLC